MAISQQLQERIEALAAELRKELYGPKGYPPWGTKFVEMEEQTGKSAMPWPVRCSPTACRSKPRRRVIRRASVVVVGSRSPWRKSPGGFSRPNGEKPPGKNRMDDASDVARLFFPHSQALGIAAG